jgi:hypothetical protein
MVSTPEVRLDETAEELPPQPESPQVTTEPSAFSAAKACGFENTCVTPPASELATAEESPP